MTSAIAGLRRLAPLAVLLGLGGCHHGSSNPPAPPLGPNVTLSGAVTFDLVPTANVGGNWELDYANTQVMPARGVTVQVINGSNVLATATTDDTGAYSVSVASNQNVFVRARAEMVRAGVPGWDVRVADNTQGDALYVLDSASFMLPSSDTTRDLHAASGWGGSGYTSTRSAAPFAILDTVYDAMQFVAANEPNLVFPSLVMHWSPNNIPSPSTNGPNVSTGQIGSTFYYPGVGIYLLGAENDDTDEYDRSVISHEWGHYLADAFGRDDSLGGPHTPGDQLDLRVAFAEGWANAMAAMETGDPVYRDTQGPGQAQGFGFNVEGESIVDPNPNPGWYSERSVHELIYDLYDSNADFVPAGGTTQDNVALGFGPLFDALTGGLASTHAVTSIFPFINAVKQAEPQAVQLDIDALTNAEGMDSIVDDYGSTETHFGSPPTAKLTSVYDSVAVNGGATNVCSLDDFKSAATGSVDKLGSRRYLRFTVTTPGSYTFSAVAVNPPAAADPDLVLHQIGEIARSEGPPSAACTQSWQTQAGVCSESFTSPAPLSPGDYVLEVYEWTNTTDDPSYPPIGDTCFDVTVTGP